MSDVLIFVVDEGYFIWRDQELYPPPGHVLTLFRYLLEHHGHWRRKAEIYPVLWPAASSGSIPDRADEIIGVKASRLARLLIGTSARVEARVWFGYRLMGEIKVV